MEAVRKIWTPENPKDDGLKLECLKRALEIAPAAAVNAGVRTADAILADAQKFYEWFRKEQE